MPKAKPAITANARSAEPISLVMPFKMQRLPYDSNGSLPAVALSAERMSGNGIVAPV